MISKKKNVDAKNVSQEHFYKVILISQKTIKEFKNAINAIAFTLEANSPEDAN